jgi:hypothetical protein
MRTNRLKITPDNYGVLSTAVKSLPKHAKGNDAVREAMNVSAGTWSYLRQSDSFENFKELSKFKKAPQTNEPGQEILTLETPQPQPRPERPIVPSLDARAICASLDKQTAAILKLADAWESTPKKKKWL